MPIDGVSGAGAGPVGGTPVSLTPPKTKAVLKQKSSGGGDPVIPVPIPDAAPSLEGLNTRFVSVPRREIEARLDPSTGRPVFRINVNGVQLDVPPNGWLV